MTLWVLVKTTLKELVYGKFYLNLLVSGFALVLAALAFDQLAAGEAGVVLLDLGMSFISLIVAVTASVATITSITREIETRQIIVAAVRAQPRALLLLGRFVAVSLVVLLSNLVLGGMLALLVAAVGTANPARVLVAVVCGSGEGFIVAALALAMGVGSSSTLSALVTACVFLAGRLEGVLAELLARGTFGGATVFVRAVRHVLPQLSRFDLSGWVAAADAGASAPLLAWAYGLVYACGLLALAIWRFQRRDLL